MESLLADFIGGLFGVVGDSRCGIFVGDGLDDGKGVLVGELFLPLQSDDRLTLSLFVLCEGRSVYSLFRKYDTVLSIKTLGYPFFCMNKRILSNSA